MNAPNPLHVTCPVCNARPLEGCTMGLRSGGRVHRAREQRAARRLGADERAKDRAQVLILIAERLEQIAKRSSMLDVTALTPADLATEIRVEATALLGLARREIEP